MKDNWDPRCYKSEIRSPVTKNLSFFLLHDFSQPSKMGKKKKINGNLVLLVLGEEVGTVQPTTPFQTFSGLHANIQ